MTPCDLRVVERFDDDLVVGRQQVEHRRDLAHLLGRRKAEAEHAAGKQRSDQSASSLLSVARSKSQGCPAIWYGQPRAVRCRGRHEEVEISAPCSIRLHDRHLAPCDGQPLDRTHRGNAGEHTPVGRGDQRRHRSRGVDRMRRGRGRRPGDARRCRRRRDRRQSARDAGHRVVRVHGPVRGDRQRRCPGPRLGLSRPDPVPGRPDRREGPGAVRDRPATRIRPGWSS